MSSTLSVQATRTGQSDDSGRLSVEQFASRTMDAGQVVQELSDSMQRESERLTGLILFCSPRYDLTQLAAEVSSTFDCPIAGCTTAGQIGPRGFQDQGLTAAGLYSDDLTLRSYLIEPLASAHAQAAQVGARARSELAPGGPGGFGLMLIDGLSMAEERVAAALHASLGLPLVGGSAGDDLCFERTHVYHDGRFVSDAATLTLFETSLPFVPVKFQNVIATDQRLVVTKARSDRREVSTFNGVPAARFYSELVGVAPLELDALTFSRHPLVLRIGDDAYVRSIQHMNPDLSLTFYCAIERGVVLRIGENIDPVETAASALSLAAGSIANPKLTLGCDCILRLLEFEHKGLLSTVGDLYAAHDVVGFSTYGEQFNGLHVNQTFTGVVLGS